MTNTPITDNLILSDWKKAWRNQATVLSAYEDEINKLQSALQEIAGGVKINKKPSGAAQINLSVLDMQEIANKALNNT
jgi:hypothetical protein